MYTALIAEEPAPQPQPGQQPSPFSNYADVLARLGYPIKLDFKSIFPEGGGDISLLPESIRRITSCSRSSTSVSWPACAKARATASPCFPEDRLPRYRTGSRAS